MVVGGGVSPLVMDCVWMVVLVVLGLLSPSPITVLVVLLLGLRLLLDCDNNLP